MTEKIINEDYTIDLDSVKTDASCPYCACNTFHVSDDIEIIPLDDVEYPLGVFENTCTKSNHKSVWMDRGQYKIVV